MARNGKGWHGQPERHSLARRGIKVKREFFDENKNKIDFGLVGDVDNLVLKDILWKCNLTVEDISILIDDFSHYGISREGVLREFERTFFDDGHIPSARDMFVDERAVELLSDDEYDRLFHTIFVNSEILGRRLKFFERYGATQPKVKKNVINYIEDKI